MGIKSFLEQQKQPKRFGYGFSSLVLCKTACCSVSRIFSCVPKCTWLVNKTTNCSLSLSLEILSPPRLLTEFDIVQEYRVSRPANRWIFSKRSPTRGKYSCAILACWFCIGDKTRRRSEPLFFIFTFKNGLLLSRHGLNCALCFCSLEFQCLVMGKRSLFGGISSILLPHRCGEEEASCTTREPQPDFGS